MSNGICLTGPAFSLTGSATFGGELASFALTFNNSQDQATVEAFEWYLDGTLIINQNQVSFSGDVACGAHTIGARILSAGGWSGIQTTTFSTCTGTGTTAIVGASHVNEGATATYQIIETFSDNTTVDITSEFTFSCPDGVFLGAVFTASINNTIGDTRVSNIFANSSFLSAQRGLTIVDTSASHASISIIGPATVDEGTSATYQAIATFPDNTTQDITSMYLFTCPDGTFNGGVLTVPNNTTVGDTRQSTITATSASLPNVNSPIPLPALSKEITVNDTSTIASLVVDVLYNTSLNIVGLLDNPEVAGYNVPAYVGQNIVPLGDTPINAFLVASDSIPWRFQFNVYSLMFLYPATTSFTFYIKGRGSVSTTLTIVYGLYPFPSFGGFVGEPGMWEPVPASYTHGDVTILCPVSGGANGSYDVADLPEIVKFVYNVASNSMTYSIPAPVTYPIPVNTIVLNDFDFMSVSFSWNQGGTRLNFYVGFENNGTQYDNQYAGNTEAQATVPADANPASAAYLWFGGIPADVSGETQEEVLISIKQFIDAFPNTPDTITLSMYAIWTSLTQNTTFGVEFTAYSGGATALNGTSFTNTGGVQNSDNSIQVLSNLFFAFRNNTPLPRVSWGLLLTPNQHKREQYKYLFNK